MELRNIQEMTGELVTKLRTESIGAINKAEKEVNVIVGRLVERGKLTQAEGQRIYTDLSNRFRTGRDELEKRLETGSRKALDRLNIPSKTEVDQLSSRINNLSRKVATLKKQLAS